MPDTHEKRDIPACALAVVLGADYADPKLQSVWTALQGDGWMVVNCTKLQPIELEILLKEEQPLLLVNFPTKPDEAQQMLEGDRHLLIGTFNFGQQPLPAELAQVLNRYNCMMHIPPEKQFTLLENRMRRHLNRMVNSRTIQNICEEKAA